MQITTTHLKRCSLIRLEGRFDSNTSPDLQQAIRQVLDAGVFRIVLDMQGVEFFGSAAIRVLVMTYKECRRWNRGDVRLCQVPERIVRVVEAVDNPAFGVLADFRNFPPGVDVYAALERLAPYARFVHAKFLSFDDRGEDPDFDTARVMETFRQARYSGLFGIEYEGKGDDHEGVLRSRELLDRYAYTLPED